MPAVQLSESVNTADSSSNPGSPDVSPNILEAITNEEQGSESKTETTNKELEKENEETEWIDVLSTGHLKMKILKQGEPDTRPQPNDVCEIKLKGTLEDGKIVDFYNSLKIQLGCHEVVQGVELVIPLMNVGEEALVVVAPRFGYGSIGSNGIPPDATITYDITLVKSSPEPCLEKIPFEKRKTLASNKKERGNWWYSRQDSSKAIQCYRKALDILDETIAFCNEEGNSIEYSEEEMREVIEQKLVIYNNLAAAQLMIEAYESALISVNRVLQLNPKNVKALFRKGKILKAKGQIYEAGEILRQAFLLEPENSAVKMELSNCVKLQQTEKQHEKKLYRKMFGQDKRNDKSVKNRKVNICLN